MSVMIIYPTETCYGIGCSVFDEASIRKIYEMKGRGPEKAMLVIVPSINEWKKIAFPNKAAIVLAEHFWPGPLTLVCGRKGGVPEMICGKNPDGTMTIACRQSPHEIASALAAQYGPIVSTSANISGGPEPYSLENVPQSLKEVADIVIDGGTLPKTKPSTIYDCINMKMIREGPISADDIKKVISRTK